MHKRKLGNKLESIAVKFLISKGYIFLQNNVHLGRIGEIDLVMKSLESEIVLVEVKGADIRRRIRAAENLHAGKLRQLRLLSEIYAAREGLDSRLRGNDGGGVRMDAVCIEFSIKNKAIKVESIEHFDNILQYS